MTINDLVKQLGLKVFSGHMVLDRDISGGYVSDLLSDVMGNAREGQVWITLQAHRNVLAIASLKDLAAIILVKNIEPDSETIQKAEEEELVVLGTSADAFTTAGMLFELLKK